MDNPPVELIKMSPEAIEIANTYLQYQNLEDTAASLGVPKDQVLEILDRSEVKRYIDNVFFELGYNNRFTLHEAMDDLIKAKFEELDQADRGSNKDIAELLMMKHKMRMEELSLLIQYEKLQQSSIKNQTNIQVNTHDSNYTKLIEQLLEDKFKNA